MKTILYTALLALAICSCSKPIIEEADPVFETHPLDFEGFWNLRYHNETTVDLNHEYQTVNLYFSYNGTGKRNFLKKDSSRTVATLNWGFTEDKSKFQYLNEEYQVIEAGFGRILAWNPETISWVHLNRISSCAWCDSI